MSQALRDARRYEESWEELITPEEKPAFHLASRVGWMNDPNGFCYYKGQYHMFYQYHPYDSHWGPMHWGHAVSSDLIHWTYMPVALAPDRYYDRDGVFSGSAITMPDGRHMLMYTGVARELAEYGNQRELQTQNIAFGDGIDYEKYEGNPIITAKDLPEGGSKYDFRDPKIWQKQDGTYRALIADNFEGEGGKILLFKSDDAIHWEFMKVFAENNNRIGLMWECPDFFKLGDKYVLSASAQDMMPRGFEYHNGNGSFYMVGSFDEETETFTPESDFAMDYGIDFYAQQTVLTADGRRIMIGWMQNWDTCNLHTKSIPWFGQMTIPRELEMKDGVIYQNPIRELEALRKNEVIHENVTVENETLKLSGVEGRTIDLTVEVSSASEEETYQRFAIRFAHNENFQTSISYRPQESTLKIDRKFSGSRRAIIHQRRAYLPSENGKIKLRIILDRYSAEVFVNDGQKVLSATIQTDLAADGVVFFAIGKVKINVTKYDLIV